RTAVRAQLSPRHLPDTIVQVDAIPQTRTGKKLELPVKRLLQGSTSETTVRRDDMAHPDAFDDFLALRRTTGQPDSHRRSTP
ncbi:MAG: hypothetical protein ACRDRL_07470, partial [Sciscionella sp.]